MGKDPFNFILFFRVNQVGWWRWEVGTVGMSFLVWGV